MEYLPLITLIFIVGLSSIVIDRRVQKRRAARQAAGEEAAKPASAIADKIQGAQLKNQVRTWRERLTPQKQPEPLQPFRAWIVEAFADQPEMRNWLAALPDTALKVFMDEIAIFCQQLGFELTWLVEHQVNEYPGLGQRLQAIVSQYSNACRDAVLAQAEIKVFKSWKAFDQNPYGKAEQEFAQQVFNRLVERGITPKMPDSLHAKSEQERQIYIVQILRQEREKQPTVFQEVLNAAVNTPAPLPQENTSTAQSKRRWFRKTAPTPEATSA